jgi:VIT1/CCC1 family predicted Fe2+/Mn2+ transporter
MAETEISKDVYLQALKSQRDEINGAALYAFMAKTQERKHPQNAKVLSQMSQDEMVHYNVWAAITRKQMKAHILWQKILTVILGFTFTLKFLEKGEDIGTKEYAQLQKEVPAAAKMAADEKHHEDELHTMLDEERLHYVGSMVLGLNDALVELTGAITGVTFSLQNCRLIALTGIVTGVAATLSMMASNYLAESAEGHKDAFKSSLYTGAAYLVTVALIVLPYLCLLGADQSMAYLWAFCIMIAEVICEIAFFNFYISVAQGQKFWKHFLLMAAISLGVAAISYGIGYAAKLALGIEV